MHAASSLLSTACSVGFQGSTGLMKALIRSVEPLDRVLVSSFCPPCHALIPFSSFLFPRPTNFIPYLRSYLAYHSLSLPLALSPSLSLSLPLSLPRPRFPFSLSLPPRSLSIICWLCRSGRSVGRRLFPVPLRPVKLSKGVLARCKAKGQRGGSEGLWARNEGQGRMF